MRFKATVRSHSSRGKSDNGILIGDPPALFTHVVNFPYSEIAAFARFSTASSSVTSVVTAIAEPPDSLISVATRSISSVLRAARTTDAPASENDLAIPSPIPRPAPVITAT